MQDDEDDEDDEDEGDDELVYELDDWDHDERQRLSQLLARDRIAFRWEGTDLVVTEADESRIDELMDEVEFPDALDATDDDGDSEGGGYEVLSQLFVSADRLAGARTVDLDQAAELAEAAAEAAEAPAPFGMEAADWARVQQLAESVVAAVDAEADDDIIAREAATLRDLLRRFV